MTIALGVPSVAQAAPLAPSGPGRTCTGATYTVVRGDGWFAIARKLKVTTKALFAANGATARTAIHPGQRLCAPGGSTAPSAGSTSTASSSTSTSSSSTASSAGSCGSASYTVVRGDGWFAIARKVGSSSTALMSANRATTRTPLYPGQVLCLPAGATSPAPSASTTPTSASVPTVAPADNEATIRAIWPDELEEEALRIARRESNLRNKAQNWCCYGLFQIHWNAHKSWLASIGVTSASQLLDPTVNATAAYTLYQRAGGFGPWQ
ncbi:MAG: LysM peptidoglycan-binding domain-containing protein [Acidimicrobiales bacterium]|nr:LysM peptidoglycan-binding domain-containing protein [Acidimicrobiales bacterium]MCB9392808.1 LysM peptidoglycan-binding domain-containing protein [Acidimicrobiaceae bacterium]